MPTVETDPPSPARKPEVHRVRMRAHPRPVCVPGNATAIRRPEGNR
ncbi:hypothetical protein [Streptomyces sp. UNOB3_S3]|nr:hypothetical protein [Streptomyces sp. UNOB3_S3]